MSFNNPSIADFKSYFERDFPFGTDHSTSVTDNDIAKAFNQTNMTINDCFFSDQTSYDIGYNLLSAHFLVMNLRMSSQGMNGQFQWLENSKAVGSVNQAFQIPQRILENPEFAMLTLTNYGAMFLHHILPNMTGQIFTVEGRTNP